MATTQLESPDLLWIDLPALRWELNVVEDSEIDAQLLRLLGAAIDEIERYTELPIRERRAVIDRRVPTENVPMFLGRIPFALTVESIQYWTEEPKPGSIPDGMVELNPDAELSPARQDQEWGDWWLRPPSAGWLQGAVCARICVLCGMAPAQHQALSQAIVMLVRDYFEGITVADRTPAWRRRLSGMPYTHFVPQDG